MKHTPWRCQYVPGSTNEFRLWDEDDNYLPLTTESDGVANARLIESAPDLLEALEKFVSAGYGNSTDFRIQGEAYDIAYKAIAKAKGETK